MFYFQLKWCFGRIKEKMYSFIQDFKGGSFKKAPRAHQPVIFPDQKTLALFSRYFSVAAKIPW